MNPRFVISYFFVFGFSLGGLAGLQIRKNVHDKDQKKLQEALKVIHYLAHIIDSNDIPMSEFDSIVIKSLISEN
jgi:hypothetical protein